MSLCAARKLAKLTLVWLLAAVLPLAAVRGAALEVTAELGGRYESNVSNSNLASDRLADGFFTAHLNAGTSGVWGRDWRWHAYLAGEGEQAFRFTGLSQIEGGIRLGVDRKFGLGWKAPRLRSTSIRPAAVLRERPEIRCMPPWHDERVADGRLADVEEGDRRFILVHLPGSRRASE
jgi:hypothetical protein